MLISNKRRFIYIHIYKTAGASITSALLPFASDSLSIFIGKLFRKAGIPKFNHRPYDDHISAKELIDKIGIDRFNRYFSFAFVRNPWDWQVSIYEFVIQRSGHTQHKLFKDMCTFDNYIEWRCKNEVRYQKDFIYSEQGELLVDFVGRYENLDEDFTTICDKIGIIAELPVLNVSRSKPYQEYYTKNSIELVRSTFAPDIEQFKYEFE